MRWFGSENKTCSDFDGFIDGTLKCGNCHFDTSKCVECTEDNLELCEDGYICPNGRCVEPGHEVSCGDDIAEGSEACDGPDLRGKSCASFDGFADGTLRCTACSYDTSECVECSTDTHCADRKDGKTHCESNVCTQPSAPVYTTGKVVISQVYSGGGNKNAVYNTKYIELLNIDDKAIDISDWSLQYGTSKKDDVSAICPLPKSASIPKGGYYLVALQQGTNGNDLIAPDHTCSTFSPAAENGKIFLVNSSTQLASSSPESGYIDAIGYGNANWSEGNHAAAALNSKIAAFRKEGGCVDTDNNGNDFETNTPSPRNSKSPANLCNGTEPSTCGNGKLDTGEDCDGKLFDGNETACSSWDSSYTDGVVSCKDCNIDYSNCSTSPSCGNGELDSNEDCDGTLFVSDETSCSAWNSKYKSGSVSCNKCKIDYSNCSTKASECTEDEAECIEKELSLKKCVNGKFVIEKCPYEKPYCKTDAEGCSLFKAKDPCNSNIFIPHRAVYNMYLCPMHKDYYYNTFEQAPVISLSCGYDCMQAKRGYGVATGNADACDTKGTVRLKQYYHSGDYYYGCQKCKVNQDGALYWLYVPATYTVKANSLSCEPWDDVE